MHRRPLLALLARYVPSGGDDREARDRIAAFVEAHADCFERSLLIGHVTASAWIVDRERTHALLTHHRKLGRWLQLGGHTDGDPDVLRSACREATEESGLRSLQVLDAGLFDCDVHRIPARGDEPAHDHHDVRFLLQADMAEPLVVSEESHDLSWVRLEDVAALETDASVLRMVEKVRRTR
ncbi:MAG TPA: NUDIX hydrolase [Candidatus Limnocylindrales bacterium]|nr:NUDIX hydrolase [Candidatus Limnocylindrales bacterium]